MNYLESEGIGIMKSEFVPELEGALRKHMIKIPTVINEVCGVRVMGKLIKSLLFSTDIAIIRNCNADAIMAVYPFTPQPIIANSIITCADVPVFIGVGGGTTRGKRVTNLAENAEYLGAAGVVVNAPTPDETLTFVSEKINIPITITVVSEKTDIEKRLESGASILNVSAAARTPFVVSEIRKRFPKVPIIATGGSTDDAILRTIDAGANAITYTPPTAAELFKNLMTSYREESNQL